MDLNLLTACQYIQYFDFFTTATGILQPSLPTPFTLRLCFAQKTTTTIITIINNNLLKPYLTQWDLPRNIKRKIKTRNIKRKGNIDLVLDLKREKDIGMTVTENIRIVKDIAETMASTRMKITIPENWMMLIARVPLEVHQETR